MFFFFFFSVLAVSIVLAESPSSDLGARSRERAARLARQAAPVDPTLAAGRAYLERGDFARAVSALLEARALYRGKPSEPAVLVSLGQAYAAQKERTLAAECFDELARRFPRSELADDAQFGKARLELSDLPSPDDLMDALRDFATFNPLSLDPDAIHYLMGVERGFRMDRIGPALIELERVWEGHPDGDRAPEALLRQAVLEGYLVSQRSTALDHLGRLLKRYPASAQVPAALVAQGFLRLLEGQDQDAATSFEAVPPESAVFPHAAFLSGLARAYLLGDLEGGRPHFEALARTPDPYWRDLAQYHRALLAFAEKGTAEPARSLLAGLEGKASPRLATWKQALQRVLDRVDRAARPEDRLLASARFWQQAGHGRRAASELERIISGYPSTAAAAEAKLALGRILAEQAELQNGERAAAARHQLLGASQSQPVPELSLEARWRARERRSAGGLDPVTATPVLDSLLAGGEVWRTRAASELADHSDTPRARGRLLRALVAPASKHPARPSFTHPRPPPEGKGWEGASSPSARPGPHEEGAEATSPPPTESPEARTARLREAADLLARQKLYRASLDLYRRILPEDPGLRPRMVRLAALAEMAELESAPELPTTSAGVSKSGPPIRRVVETAEMLLAAGERKPAEELLARAAGRPGGSPARVRLLALELESKPLDLTALARVNSALDRKDLADEDRYRLLELKARILDHQGVEQKKAVEIYHLLVSKKYRPAELTLTLARHALDAGKPREALTLLARQPKSPHRDLVEAEALAALADEAGARDCLVRLVSAHPSRPEGALALRRLAAIDSARLQEACGAAPATGATSATGPRQAEDDSLPPSDEGTRERLESVDEVLSAVLPAELGLLAGALDTVARAIAAMPVSATRERRPGLRAPSERLARLGRLLKAHEAAGASAARRAELLKLQIALRPEGKATATDLLELSRALAASGRAREAFELLHGLGAQAALAQARLLHDDLRDPSRAEEQVRLLATAPGTPTPLRGEALALLASWHRGQADERSLLERSVASGLASTEAVAARERLAELARARGDQAEAARQTEAAAARVGDATRPGRLLTAARAWLAAGNLADASRLAQGLLGAPPESGVADSAREVLALVGGRQQVEALVRALDQDDPENPANREKLQAIARAQTKLLGDCDAADTTLLSLVEQFPDQAGNPEVSALRSELAVRRAVTRHEQQGARGLLRAGLMREESLDDPRGAVRDYERVLETTDPKAPETLLARLYLIRVQALHLSGGRQTLRLLDEAEAHPAAGDYRRMLETARHLARLTAPPSSADWRAAAELATGRLQDPELLSRALDRAGAGLEASRAALAGARGLDPLAAVTPLGPGTAELLERAVATAPPGLPRARALVALGDWRRAQGDPERAAECYRAARATDAGTEVAALAAVREGSLQTDELEDAGAAVEAYGAAARVVGPFQQLAAAKLPLLLARRDADLTEDELSRTRASGNPKVYLDAARRQAKDPSQLDRSIANYRAFLRVSADRALKAAAHRELAEVLVRAERGRQAVECLAQLVDQDLAPDSTTAALLRMAEILETRLADPAEARRFYQEVKRLEPRSAAAAKAQAGLTRIEDASRVAKQAVTADVASKAPGEELSAIREKYLDQAKDPEGAVQALRKQLTVTTDPVEQAKVQTELATLLEAELQDWQGAAEAYEKAIEGFGTGDRAAELTLKLATLKSERLEDPKKAMELYDAWAKTYYAHPKKIAVMLERARLLETALDNAQAALDIYRNLANAHPRSGYDEQALLRIAHLSRTYFADHLGAVEAFDQIARRFPYGPNAQTALLQAAQISELELGDLARATAFYNRLVVTYPTSGLAAEARNALARIERRRR